MLYYFEKECKKFIIKLLKKYFKEENMKLAEEQ